MNEGQKKQIWAAAQYLKEIKVGVALRFMMEFPEVFTPTTIQAYKDEVREKARKTLDSVGVKHVLD